MDLSLLGVFMEHSEKNVYDADIHVDYVNKTVVFENKKNISVLDEVFGFIRRLAVLTSVLFLMILTPEPTKPTTMFDVWT